MRRRKDTVRLGPGGWSSRKKAELRVPAKPKVAAGTSAGREGARHEACRPGQAQPLPWGPPGPCLTIGTRGTAVGPGAVTMEVSPQVHTDPSVGTRRRLAVFLVLAAQEDILAKVLGQQEMPVHLHILEAARKGHAAQLGEAGPSRCGGRGGRGRHGHGTGGHTEAGRTAFMPEPQLQDTQAERHLHSVPVAIIDGWFQQPQEEHILAVAPERGLKPGLHQRQLHAALSVRARGQGTHTYRSTKPQGQTKGAASWHRSPYRVPSHHGEGSVLATERSMGTRWAAAGVTVNP